MKNLRKLLVVVLLTSFVGFLFVGFSNPASASPRKPKEIRICLLNDLTGPYASASMPIRQGFLDACAYINERGGIKGVPIKVVERDAGGKVGVAISHYMEIREMTPKPLGIVGYVSDEGEALKERFVEDKIPAMWVTATPVLYPAQYTFGVYPIYPDFFGLFIDWMVDDWWPKQEWYKKRAPRLAFLTWDSSYGRAVLTDECYAYAKKKGVEIVAAELYGLRDVDVTTQLVRIRSKKADWIYNNSTSHGPVVVAKSMHGLGYKVNFASTPFDHAVYRLGGEIMSGTIAPWSCRSPDEIEQPGVKIVLDYFKKIGRESKHRTNFYTLLWAVALTFKEAISRAVDEVGWERLDGAAVKVQLERLGDFTPMGLYYPNYTSTKRSPHKAMICRAEGGKILPITGWRDCPDLRPAKFK